MRLMTKKQKRAEALERAREQWERDNQGYERPRSTAAETSRTSGTSRPESGRERGQV